MDIATSGGTLRRVVGHCGEWWDIAASGGTLRRVVGHCDEWWDIAPSGGTLQREVALGGTLRVCCSTRAVICVS